MELLSRNEKVIPRSGTKFSRANPEAPSLPCICALVCLGSRRRLPSLLAAQAESAHPLSFPACQEKALGEESCVSTPHARTTLTVLYNPSSQPIQNTATLEEQNQTKPFLMLRLPRTSLRQRRGSEYIRLKYIHIGYNRTMTWPRRKLHPSAASQIACRKSGTH
jgi:hypothetical protein